jgi:hypothetical protein
MSDRSMPVGASRKDRIDAELIRKEAEGIPDPMYHLADRPAFVHNTGTALRPATDIPHRNARQETFRG